MLIKLLSVFEEIEEHMFGTLDGFINNLPAADFVKDALCDSIHLIPFLFFIFLLIELFETYFSGKIKDLSGYSKKAGPLAGALLAGLPQCGFSVIAAPLYLNRVITKGTLIAVYISTSDEAIPILLSSPEYFKDILPILCVKICLGAASGYLVDMLFPPKLQDGRVSGSCEESGCCSHHISPDSVKEVLLHPVKHTINIFAVILIISLILNFCFELFGTELFNKVLLNNSIFQPVIAAFVGLIPNCAVSVLLTMLYIKGVLSFASVISGLSSSAGLGLIVLIKRSTDSRDTLSIIGILLAISILAGLCLSIFH